MDQDLTDGNKCSECGVETDLRSFIIHWYRTGIEIRLCGECCRLKLLNIGCMPIDSKGASKTPAEINQWIIDAVNYGREENGLI